MALENAAVLPWATPYPLPRDTSEALLAEGHCENFGLLLERYLAYGDNRGQLQLLRELSDRRALVPDFTGQKELIESYHARWQLLAEDFGAITFSARPQWRLIVGLGTNAILGGGITLHPVFGFPIIPATALKGVSRATPIGCSSGRSQRLIPCSVRPDDPCPAGTCSSWKASPRRRRWSNAT